MPNKKSPKAKDPFLKKKKKRKDCGCRDRFDQEIREVRG
jgi:hypothetical protein